MSTILRETEVNERYRVQRFVGKGGAPLSRREVLAGWAAGGELLDVFAAALRAAPFEAFFWETPVWTPDSLDVPYEHCVLDAPALAAVSPNPEPFREHFGAQPVSTFASLRGDATLVAPTDVTGSYPHFAAFLRTAPADVIAAAFRALAAAVPGRLEPRCWVSTSGLGVHWLHLRVDEHPKYYLHRPYR